MKSPLSSWLIGRAAAPSRGRGRGWMLAAALALSACASYTQDSAAIRMAYRGGSYQSALDQLDQSPLKEQERNQLIYLLERAMVLDRLGERKRSRVLLDQASRVVDKLYTVSASSTAASFLYNDSAADYEGEDYEKVAIHTISALSYLEGGNLDDAAVEARQINQRLLEINQRYEEGKNRYGEDAFARYLAGMIYEAKGNLDSAIIDYSRALELYQTSYRKNFSTPLPDDLVAALYRVVVKRHRSDKVRELEKEYPSITAKAKPLDAGTGELVVVHEVDTIAIKVPHDFIIPVGRQIVRFSFPVIQSRHYGYYGQTGVDVSGKFERAELAQNMDAIASQTLEDRRGRMLLKGGARLILKGQLTQQAEKNFGPLGGLAANIYGAVTETADTRAWTLLPAAFYVTRVPLKGGTYTVKVKSNGRIGQIKTVKIVPGKITFLRDNG